MNSAKPAFDPKLRKAMAEMMAIARKYDIAATLILGSREHGETRFQFPTWSTAQVEEKGGKLALRIKTKGRPAKDTDDTVSFLSLVRLRSAQNAVFCEDVLGMLADHGVDTNTDIDQGPEAPGWEFR